jgi:hypothetical protein
LINHPGSNAMPAYGRLYPSLSAHVSTADRSPMPEIETAERDHSRAPVPPRFSLAAP